MDLVESGKPKTIFPEIPNAFQRPVILSEMFEGDTGRIKFHTQCRFVTATGVLGKG
jgi:hypothetical protein